MFSAFMFVLGFVTGIFVWELCGDSVKNILNP